MKLTKKIVIELNENEREKLEQARDVLGKLIDLIMNETEDYECTDINEAADRAYAEIGEVLNYVVESYE